MRLVDSIRLAIPIFLSLSLVACGGGGGFSATEVATTTTSTTTTSQNPDTGDTLATEQSNINALRLVADSFQLESDGSNPITISALAKDVNNVLLDDPVVSLSVDNEADITAFSGTSIKTATLTPGVSSNRTLTVTASAGTITETLTIDVVGTQLSLVGPERIALDEPTEYRLLARDSGGNPIANQTITVPTVADSNPCIITPSENGNTLNTAGEYVFQITATQGGNCTLSANDFGVSTTLAIAVSGDEFEINASTDPADDVPNGNDNVLEIRVDTPETINLSLKRDGNAVTSEEIQLSTTRGTITNSVVTTDSNGNATFTINSANAGNAVITASTANGLTDTLTLEFVATVPAYINTQASPTIVRPLGTSTITTRLRDSSDNPVANTDVEFNLEGTVGGSLNNSRARTDLLGVASVEYTAGNTTSALDGVMITSKVLNTTIEDIVNLTIGGDALRVVLGTDNKLTASGVLYQQTFVVLVTDSAGNPVPDQEVNVSIVPTRYYKGSMVIDTLADQWVKNETASCFSEDTNSNGQLDNGEDLNGNNRLEPTNDASVSPADVASTTGNDGTLLVTVSYPKSRALWSRQELVARISSNGTDFEERTSFDLGILAADVSNIEIAPPNRISPYGESNDCLSAD